MSITRKQIRIIIAEDHSLFRSLLKKELEQFDIITLAEAADGLALMHLLPQYKPDLVLLDIEMPKMNGTEAVHLIKEHFPEIKIIMISQYDDKNLVDTFVKLGVNGYIPKLYIGESVEELSIGIKRVSKGGLYFVHFNRGQYVEYSERELEIIPLICEGRSNKEMASIMHLSEKSIEKHKHNLYIKSDTTNPSALVRFYLKKGFEFLKTYKSLRKIKL